MLIYILYIIPILIFNYIRLSHFNINNKLKFIFILNFKKIIILLFYRIQLKINYSINYESNVKIF